MKPSSSEADPQPITDDPCSPTTEHSTQQETPEAEKSPVQPAPNAPPTNTTPYRNNTVGYTMLYGVSIVCLQIDGKERLCLAQISNTLLKNYSYNEIHNRRVALGITCVQCTPVQLEILRRAGAMPISSRRCGMISKREAERLVKSFLEDNNPPKLPDNFAFEVQHSCGWGCRGSFLPARYNSSRAKCIKCTFCNMFFSPNKFIFHYHRNPDSKYSHPDAANFNSWRRHMTLADANASDEMVHAWEDVKAMFNGGSRKRILNAATSPTRRCGGSSNGNQESKRQKITNRDLPPSSTPAPPIQTPTNPFSCPMFPVNNHPKIVSPGLKPLPQHPAMFALPFNLHKAHHPSHAPMKDHDQSGTPFPNMHETLYPPYEMIWAKHLGLDNTESEIASTGCSNIPKLNPRIPSNLPNSHSQMNPSRPIDFSAKALMSKPSNQEPHRPLNQLTPVGKHHFSAFKPVGSNFSDNFPPNLMAHPKLSNEVIPKEDEDQHQPLSAETEQFESDGEDTVDVDVDTVEECPELDLEQNNNITKECPSDDEEGKEEESVSEEIDRECTSSPVVQTKAHDEEGVDYQNNQAAEDEEEEDSVSRTHDMTYPTTQSNDQERDYRLHVSRDGVYRDFSSFSKERLQEELLLEIQVRQKIELDCRSIQDTFREQAQQERRHRDEMTRQIQFVKDTLRQELEHERKIRLALQQKLKEAHAALNGMSYKLTPPMSNVDSLIPR